MLQQTKIFLALPRHDAIRDAIRQALVTAADLKLGSYELARDICEAEIVIADTATIDFDLTNLPETVRYLQLIDCGSGTPHVTDDNLTIANASSLLASNAANRAIQQWQDTLSRSQYETENVAGIIGFGTLGYEIGKRLNQVGAQIWINDIRTPRQQSFQQIGARRSSLDMLLSTSDVVFIAVHPGPTSNPLLSRRELQLLTTDATIINLSGPQVVDTQAIKTLNSAQQRAINYRNIASSFRVARGTRESEAITQEVFAGSNCPVNTKDDNPEIEAITRYLLDNLGNYALNRQPRSIVETVTHPSAGDPAFWASRMSPRQTPV